MTIVPMERLVSTDNVKILVTVEQELSVLWRTTDQSVSVLQATWAILRYPVILLVVSLTASAETGRLVLRENVSTPVWSRTPVEDLLNVILPSTGPTVDVCQDTRAILLLVVRLLDVALIQSVHLTRHAETRTVSILVSMRIHVRRMLNVLSVITSLSVAVPLVTQATLVWPASPSHHQSVSRTRTVHHNTHVLTTGVSSSVPSSAHAETPPPAPSLTLCQCAP